VDLPLSAALSPKVKSMRNTLSHPQHRALLVLLIATAISFHVSHDSSIGIWAGVAALAIAYVKARLVMLDFMELRHAPRSWRLVFEVSLLVVSTVLIMAYGVSERNAALSLAADSVRPYLCDPG
jgi:caa(3)-type oxidase subunit IV